MSAGDQDYTSGAGTSAHTIWDFCELQNRVNKLESLQSTPKLTMTDALSFDTRLSKLEESVLKLEKPLIRFSPDSPDLRDTIARLHADLVVKDKIIEKLTEKHKACAELLNRIQSDTTVLQEDSYT